MKKNFTKKNKNFKKKFLTLSPKSAIIKVLRGELLKSLMTRPNWEQKPSLKIKSLFCTLAFDA